MVNLPKLFINLRFKQFIRSKSFNSGIVTKIFIGLGFMYFFAIFFMMGYFFDELAEETTSYTRTQLVHLAIGYYLGLDLLLKVMIQDIDSINLKHLSLLPISRYRIIRWLINTSIISIYNILPLAFIIPIVFKYLPPDYSFLSILAWFVAVCCFLVLNTIIALRLKPLVSQSFWRTLLLFVIIGCYYWVNIQTDFPLYAIVDIPLSLVLKWQWPVLIVILLVWLAYRGLVSYLRTMVYDHLNSNKTLSVYGASFEGLNRFGSIGSVLRMNLQLFLRNKRIRIQLFMIPFFLVYNVWVFGSDQFGTIYRLFFASFVTGAPLMIFGMYIWNYQSGHFELLSTIPWSVKRYLTWQYISLVVVCALMTLLSMLNYFVNPEAPFMLLATFFFNVGIILPLVLIFAHYQNAKIDINSGGAFNMQGASMRIWIYTSILFGLPIFIVLPFHLFGHTKLGLTILMSIGVFACLFASFVIKEIVKLYQEKKYKLTELFREP